MRTLEEFQKEVLAPLREERNKKQDAGSEWQPASSQYLMTTAAESPKNARRATVKMAGQQTQHRGLKYKLITNNKQQ